MSYLVLARKWRPKTFSEVIGQQHVLRALINGLDQDRLHHAFLFSGTRGVGKTTLARILAKSLNCEQGVSSTPCGTCGSCLEVDEGRFVDLIEIDAASRTGVDDMRDLLNNAQYAPSRGRYKVYLIDEIHMLSGHSFNALLKTLEEPPPHVKFLFATTDPEKLPVTILSRCLQFNLRRLEITQISNHLNTILQHDGTAFEEAALLELARAADGSMRDALSLLDQAISYGDGKVSTKHVHQMLGTIEHKQVQQIITALINNDGKELLAQAAEISAQGRDFNKALDALLSILQLLATLQMVPNLEADEFENYPHLKPLSDQISAEQVQLLYQIALHGKRDLPYAADPQSGFEMTLLRMLSFQPKKADAISTQDNSTVIQSSSPSTPVIAKNHPQTDDLKPASTAENLSEIKEEPAELEQKQSEKIADDVSISAENWTEIISALKLSGITRQLADNAAFISFDKNKLQLSLANELAHLGSQKAQDRLQAALEKHLNQPVKLAFNDPSSAKQAGQTLADQRSKQESIQKQQAVDAIHNDPAIDALKQSFDARIIESSIKPIN